MDSQLVYALKQNRGQAIANGVPTLETRVDIDADSRTIVDISVNDAVLAQKLTCVKLQQVGAEIISAVGGSIRARVPMENLEIIAALPEVRFVSPRQDAKTSRAGNQGGVGFASFGVPTLPAMRPGFAERVARVRTQLLAALPGLQKGLPPASTNVVNTSEGDATHKANTARSSFGINGTGVKIGVLSDGVSNLAAAQATGDLGPVTVLPGQTGSGDEGTAMLELVHDLAPGSQLFFATAFTSLTSFAQNIRDLRTAGCDIIIDDVIYFVESPFQDGAPGVTNTNGGGVTQAVVDVTTAGAMYFSSAGNEGNVNDATASVWEGDFVDGGASPVAAITGGTVHNFGGGNLNNQITTAGARAVLFWSDPLGASSNDYDLFTLNAAGTAVAASSTNIQNGTQDPVEDGGNRTTNQRLVILKKTGAAARFIHLTCFGAEMALVTSGTTHGHNSAPLAFGCAATPAADAFCAGFTDGPFPGPFTTANKVECFSSDGPRRILYNANSTPITPGNVSSTGGVLRQKPDITAADGTAVTGVGGFPNPFYGTSAAAPHAGAIAALVKSAVPGITNAQVRTALVTSALDIEAAGVDRDSGAGIIMAFEAVQAAGGAPMAVITSAGATLVSESCTPANGALDPGETVTVSFCVQNTGAVNTTNLVGTLQATGGVTSPSGPQNYGVVVAGGPPVCRNFTFNVTGTCGGTVTATIQFQDGATNLGNVTYTFTLGTENVVFSENFDGVTAPALPAGWTTASTNGDGDCTVGGPLCALATNWTTATGTADTAPNAAFHNDPSCVTNATLDSPSIAITSASAKLTFRNNFNVEDTFDGGVLEISIGGGPFADILAAGGSFTSGGYTDTISTSFLSPIAGRQAWSGNSSGFITTAVNLPAAANGQNIVLRFRMASDCSLGVTGWRVDTIRVSNGFVCSTCEVNTCSITCPANITRSNDPNQCGAVVTYPAPTSTGTCGTITCNPPSGSFFPVGTTTVTCTASAGGGANTNGAPGCQTITQSSSQAITPLNSVSCNNGVGHTDNSYFRAFTLSSFGIVNAFDVQSIDVGIEDAISGGAANTQAADHISRKKGKSLGIRPQGAGQPITVNIYTSSTAFPAGFPGSLTLIGTASVNVADQSGTILNVPITGTAPAGSQLVVEVFTPDGEAAGNLFFIGSNAAAETGPSYLLAADCGITTPTTTSAIGFPDMHIVLNVNGCEQQGGGGGGTTCTFTITVNDTQPPVITCPANVTAVTPTVGDPCTVVNFTTTASDNCPGVTVVCNPPSGSCFPVGVTTVTCTATDAAGNTATCTFTVSVFNARLQDDSAGCNNTVLFNTITGAYRWCCNGTIFTGVGSVKKLGSTFTLTHNAPDRKVLITLSAGSFPPSGTGSIQSPPGQNKCTIQDRDTRNDTCVCGGAVPVAAGK
ncbi:MAG: HYR domain-containing protein [Blastocatellia bacterium]